MEHQQVGLEPKTSQFRSYFLPHLDEIMNAYNHQQQWALIIHFNFSSSNIMVESSDKMWSTGEGNGKPLQHSCRKNPMNSMKRQKDMTLKDELPRSVGAQCATGEEWRNNSRKNEEMEPKQKQHPAVDVTVIDARFNVQRAILHRNLEC